MTKFTFAAALLIAFVSAQDSAVAVEQKITDAASSLPEISFSGDVDGS
jgi:hypothetical protein